MNLLEVKNLKTHFFTKKGVVKAVDGVNFSIEPGKTIGIVGESGSGKSITSMSVMGLLENPGKIVEGEIFYNGENLVNKSEKEMRSIRGNDVSMIFQEPMTSLNPVFKIGYQIAEVIKLHQKLSKHDAHAKAVEMLRMVGIPRPEQIANNYPHQLSGGMRQRVMIAIALACRPKLLIADEPTTALDVTIQAQILELMNELKRETNTAIMLITHDLGVIGEMADHVIVMYCGKVVEDVEVTTIFDRTNRTKHPYTQGLLNSIPELTDNKKVLDQIDGAVPNPLHLPKGCNFAPRCKFATAQCHTEEPQLTEVSKGHKIACFHIERGGVV